MAYKIHLSWFMKTYQLTRTKVKQKSFYFYFISDFLTLCSRVEPSLSCRNENGRFRIRQIQNLVRQPTHEGQAVGIGTREKRNRNRSTLKQIRFLFQKQVRLLFNVESDDSEKKCFELIFL